MFRHILTIIWNNRRHNGWLIAGLFVMSTCMWYAVDYVYTVTVNQTRPLGFDWHNVYALNIGVLTPESHKFLSDKLHTKNAKAAKNIHGLIMDAFMAAVPPTDNADANSQSDNSQRAK